MVCVLVGVRGCVLQPTGHSLVTLFPSPCRLRTGCCIGFYSGHRLIILSTYFLMGAGRLVALLSRIRLFLDRLMGRGDGGGPCAALSPGFRGGGLESKFGWGPGHLDRRMVGWSCLCLGYKRGICFGVSSWATLVHESLCNTV